MALIGRSKTVTSILYGIIFKLFFRGTINKVPQASILAGVEDHLHDSTEDDI